MKIHNDYPEIIALENSYETSPELKEKAPFGPWVKFFLGNFLGVIFRSNRKTKKFVYDRYNWAASSVEIMHGIEKAGVEINITGMDNIRELDGPVVYVANHMSTLETMILPGIIQPVNPVTFVIKKELADYPLFGPVVSARHPIIVGRSNPREDLKIVMDEGKERLERGMSVIIFPQRTRTGTFIEKEFNTLGIKLAQRNKVPVVPVALVTDAWGNGKLVKEFGPIDPSKKVHIEFGKPFEVGNPTEDHKNVIEFIKNKLKEWGREELIK